jgi:hypothetical protein
MWGGTAVSDNYPLHELPSPGKVSDIITIHNPPGHFT